MPSTEQDLVTNLSGIVYSASIKSPSRARRGETEGSVYCCPLTVWHHKKIALCRHFVRLFLPVILSLQLRSPFFFYCQKRGGRLRSAAVSWWWLFWLCLSIARFSLVGKQKNHTETCSECYVIWSEKSMRQLSAIFFNSVSSFLARDGFFTFGRKEKSCGAMKTRFSRPLPSPFVTGWKRAASFTAPGTQPPQPGQTLDIVSQNRLFILSQQFFSRNVVHNSRNFVLNSRNLFHNFRLCFFQVICSASLFCLSASFQFFSGSCTMVTQTTPSDKWHYLRSRSERRTCACLQDAHCDWFD